MPRANAIRFSTNAVLARRQAGASAEWALSFRVANIRKHTLLDPEVSAACTPATRGGEPCFWPRFGAAVELR